MSAWIVSKAHIDLMVTAGLLLARPHGPMRWNKTEDPSGPWDPATLDHTNADEIGRMLWAENFHSVNFRYPGERPDELPGPDGFDSEELATYRHQNVPGELDPVVVLKAISCFEYQSCEHDGWKTSQAYRFCIALRDVCIGKLAGYDAAPWGFVDRDFFRKQDARA